MRGIQTIDWKNTDGSVSTRYRVRINRKGIKKDKLFDSLEEAKAFLYDSKTSIGRERIAQNYVDDVPMSQFLTLKHNLDVYYKEYFDNENRTEKTYEYMIKQIVNAKVSNQNFVASLGIMAKEVELPKVNFGDVSLKSINIQTANEYIKYRLKSVKKATVMRELSLLTAFWNKIKHFNFPLWKMLDGTNPFADCDKSLLSGHDVRRKRRFKEGEEQRLFDELVNCKNKEMLYIVLLALSTGMRRSEILSLRWEQIKDGFIYLDADQTKGEYDREVALSEDALKVLSLVPKVDKKLFHYTAEGFSTNWQRVKERANLKDFRFHDLRREMISRVFEMNSNAILVSKLTGMIDVRYIESAYNQQQSNLHSQQGLMRSVGHKDLQIHARYVTLKK